MKRLICAITVSALMLTTVAFAEEVKLVGTITKIQLEESRATVTLKDSNSQETVVTVTDQLTLDKFKDKRISNGDEVRVKFDTTDRVTKLFRKTAGC